MLMSSHSGSCLGPTTISFLQCLGIVFRIVRQVRGSRHPSLGWLRCLLLLRRWRRMLVVRVLLRNVLVVRWWWIGRSTGRKHG